MATRVATTTRAGTTTSTRPAATDFISVCRTRGTAQAAADKAVTDAQAAATKMNSDAAAAAAKMNKDAAAAAAKLTADAKAAADKAIATAKTQADAAVKAATDNQTAVRTRLQQCPVPPTPGDLTAMNGTFQMDTATATLTIPGNGRRWVRSTKPLASNNNAYVSFQMTGAGSLGYTFYIGFSEMPQPNNQLAVGNIQTTLLLGFTYDVNKKAHYTYVHTGNDGEGGFIQMQNPQSNEAPPGAGAALRMRKVTDNNSTFIIHFDGSKYNFYHNAKLVHSQPAAKAPTRPLSLFMSTDGDNMPVKITNLIFGNAPTATDIPNFAKTLPQTGGRRRGRRSNRGSRRSVRAGTRRSRRVATRRG